MCSITHTIQYINTLLPYEGKCEEKEEEKKKKIPKRVYNTFLLDALRTETSLHGNQFRCDCRVLNSKTVDFIILPWQALGPATLPCILHSLPAGLVILSADNIEDRGEEAGKDAPDANTDFMVDKSHCYEKPTKKL